MQLTCILLPNLGIYESVSFWYKMCQIDTFKIEQVHCYDLFQTAVEKTMNYLVDGQKNTLITSSCSYLGVIHGYADCSNPIFHISGMKVAPHNDISHKFKIIETIRAFGAATICTGR